MEVVWICMGPDLGIFEGLLPLSETGNSAHFTNNSRSYRHYSYEIFQRLDVSLATNHSILVLIQIQNLF